MHIYIQRGGRRPSATSVNLSKSRSLQSLQDTSPRLREKILEYDKKRREQEKFERQIKPKPRPKPLPVIAPNPTPPKVERRKYVPDIEQHPKMISTKPLFEPEKHAPVDHGKSSLIDSAKTHFQIRRADGCLSPRSSILEGETCSASTCDTEKHRGGEKQS